MVHVVFIYVLISTEGKTDKYMMLVVEITPTINDRYKPLGYSVGSLTRELWLCDLTCAGIAWSRVSDTEISVSERDYTIISLFYSTPDLDLVSVNVV